MESQCISVKSHINHIYKLIIDRVTNLHFNSIPAERKQSLGYDWHPECLRCEECGKRLNPGQHAEVNEIFMK